MDKPSTQITHDRIIDVFLSSRFVTMTASAFAVTMLLLSLSAIALASAATPDDQIPAAVIKFIGIQHGYPSEPVARASFANSLSVVIGQSVAIDEFDMRDGGLIVWHTNELRDCNETELKQLLARIRSPGTGAYTRDFKMFMGPEFSHPKRVEVEWRGRCENLGRKRTLDTAPGERGSTESQGITTTTDSSPSSSSTPESTTVSPTLATPDEPSQPVSTTEQPQTIPFELTEASRRPDDVPITIVEPMATLAPMVPMEPVLFSDADTGSTQDTTTTTTTPIPTPAASTSTSGPDATATTTNTTTTTTTATTTTTTAAAAATTTITSATSDREATSSEPSQPNPTTVEPIPSQSTMEQPEDIPAELKDTTSGPTEEAPTSDNKESVTIRSTLGSGLSLSSSQSDAAMSNSSSSAASSPHYGKYIGLTTGFFVFIAYLLCARAYRRQGMYELQEST